MQSTIDQILANKAANGHHIGTFGCLKSVEVTNGHTYYAYMWTLASGERIRFTVDHSLIPEDIYYSDENESDFVALSGTNLDNMTDYFTDVFKDPILGIGIDPNADSEICFETGA